MLGGLVDHTPKPRVALEAAEAHRVATVSRRDLAEISPISPPYLAYISPYLPERRRRTAWPRRACPHSHPTPTLTPTPTPEPEPEP